VISCFTELFLAVAPQPGKGVLRGLKMVKSFKWN